MIGCVVFSCQLGLYHDTHFPISFMWKILLHIEDTKILLWAMRETGKQRTPSTLFFQNSPMTLCRPRHSSQHVGSDFRKMGSTRKAGVSLRVYTGPVIFWDTIAVIPIHKYLLQERIFYVDPISSLLSTKRESINIYFKTESVLAFVATVYFSHTSLQQITSARLCKDRHLIQVSLTFCSKHLKTEYFK